MAGSGEGDADIPVITVADSTSAAEVRDQVMAVWISTFGPIDDVEDWRESVWERHRRRADYRLATTRLGDDLVGFSWGYTGQRGQFWTDYVLEQVGPRTCFGDPIEDWVGGHFEFVELTVLSSARRRGIGGQLHDALLAGLPHHHALLGTKADPDDPAVRLYEARGWRRLGQQAPGDQVMGKILAGPTACDPAIRKT